MSFIVVVVVIMSWSSHVKEGKEGEDEAWVRCCCCCCIVIVACEGERG